MAGPKDAAEVVDLVNGFIQGRWAEHVRAVEAAGPPWFADFDPVEVPR